MVHAMGERSAPSDAAAGRAGDRHGPGKGVVLAIVLALYTLTPLRLVSLDTLETPVLAVSSRFSRDDADGENHRYTVTVSRGSILTVHLRSAEVDPNLEVSLPDGRQIANDDYDGLDAGLVETILADGVVEIVAAPITSLQEGRYELTVYVREPEDGSPGGTTPMEALRTVEDTRQVLLVRSGRLEWGDARAYDGKFVDTVPYEATGGETVMIELVSEDFDAVLFVASSDGIIQGDDDDSGEGSNARLSITFPEDGRYEIRVTSYVEATGTYVLTVFR
jgi:hypothetical protein